MAAFKKIQTEYDEESIERIKEVMLPMYMSSEESGGEDDGLVVRPLSWESDDWRSVKQHCDEVRLAGDRSRGTPRSAKRTRVTETSRKERPKVSKKDMWIVK